MEKTYDRSTELEVFPPSMSTLEAARRLGVTVPTIQRWLDQGVLRGWKTPGGHRRIAQTSVQSYIDSRMAPPTSTGQGEPDILIIEDDPIYMELLRESLMETMPKARIRFAHDGFEGLAEVAAELPSCVITDIRMPHMDGVEMIRHLLTRHASLAGRVLVMSAGDGGELAALGVLRAAVSFLPKATTSIEMLRAGVAQLLRG